MKKKGVMARDNAADVILCGLGANHGKHQRGNIAGLVYRLSNSIAEYHAWTTN